jgi:hypothetical protein
MSQPLPKKKLPIGIQTFSKMRAGGFYYVDKTRYAVRLAKEAGYYFLSRPRRFGKSLFLDTLKDLFEAKRELFDELYAAEHWDWSVAHPVVRVSFSDAVGKQPDGLRVRIRNQLLQNVEQLKLATEISDDIAGSFSDLIRQAEAKFGQKVVLLVDEYDKPILDNIEDTAVATAMREGLRDFYSVIKAADPYLRFVLLTGVSKFSKVSLFSGLNNLRDISLEAEYSAICGYTEEDVDTVFAAELEGLDRQQIRDWYNGYNWTGEAVYNPFDLLLLFAKREFKAHWYETGTPTFLFKLLKQRQKFIPDLHDLLVDDVLLSTFDVDNIPTESLLFQAGYLTIADKRFVSGKTLYRLKYPNREVYQSLTDGLLRDWTPSTKDTTLAQVKLYDLLLAHDLDGIGRLMSGFYESILHQWHMNNPIAQYEGYYASVFYAFFASLGLDLQVEESSNAGRLDMTLRFQGRVIIFEFKVLDDGPTPSGNSALATIAERGYARRWEAAGQPVDCVGIEFSSLRRRIVAWDVA